MSIITSMDIKMSELRINDIVGDIVILKIRKMENMVFAENCEKAVYGLENDIISVMRREGF